MANPLPVNRPPLFCMSLSAGIPVIRPTGAESPKVQKPAMPQTRLAIAKPLVFSLGGDIAPGCAGISCFMAEFSSHDSN
jgi:hypothetical protein